MGRTLKCGWYECGDPLPLAGELPHRTVGLYPISGRRQCEMRRHHDDHFTLELPNVDVHTSLED